MISSWIARRGGLSPRMKYLAGRELTLADIGNGILVHRWHEYPIERPPLPQVKRWYHTLQQRAPFRQHIMIPFEELRGRLLDR